MTIITVIIPAFNAEKTISRCLDSVLAQTFSDYEVIVIDDGSNDSTYSIVEKYCLIDKRIKIIRQDNRGVSAARNRGLSLCDSEFVYFLDSDDSIVSETLQVMINIIENCDLAISGITVYADNIILRTPHLNDEIVNLTQNIDIYWKLRKINLGPWNKLYRRDKITSQFDESLTHGEDAKFVMDYLENIKSIAITSKCLNNIFLDNKQSLNRSDKSSLLPQLLKVRQHEEKFLSTYYNEKFDYRIFNQYFFDLHVVLYDAVKTKMDSSNIKQIINLFDYNSIYQKTKFNKIYYEFFSWLVVKKHIFILKVLLKIRATIIYIIFHG